jgi:hypothetical protein
LQPLFFPALKKSNISTKNSLNIVKKIFFPDINIIKTILFFLSNIILNDFINIENYIT